MNINVLSIVKAGVIAVGMFGAMSLANAQQGSSVTDECITDPSGERTELELDCVFNQKLPNYLRQLGSSNEDMRQINGNIVVGATVMPSGQVSESWVVSGDINDPLIASLIADAVKNVDFGEKGSADVEVEYSMRFVNGVPHISRQ